MFQRTVMPYSATPPNPAITRSSRFSNNAPTSRTGADGSKPERLDLQPVDRHHGVAVVHQVMRQREAGRTEPDDQHLAPAVRARQRAADVQRVPARQQRVDLEAPGQLQHVLQDARSRPAEYRPAPASGRCRPSCSRCRCDGRSPPSSGCRSRWWRTRRARCPAARSVCISLIFSSSGQPASVTPNGDFWNCAGLAILQARAAGILALRVAPDAVVDLVQRLLRVHPGIGQREAVARPPVMLRQAQHRHAVALDGFNRNQMLVVEPVRHAEQRVAGMRRAARLGQRRPGGVAQRHIQRRGVAGRLPRRDMLGEAALGQRARRTALPARRAARRRRSRDGSGYFFTAWRCTNSRLQAWIGSSAWVCARQRQRLRLDAEQRGDEAIEMRRRAPPPARSRP